jgi:SepF-like predicted cell division protein (DUF552 family)
MSKVFSTIVLKLFEMNFLKKLFVRKPPEEITQADYELDIKEYQTGILSHCIEHREELIKRISCYEMKDIDQAISDFEEELVIIKITDTALMCRIVEEKLSQFKKAKMLCEKNKAGTSQLI